MSTNTGLIARLREGQTYDFNTGLPNDMSCPMDDAADAIEALEAEVESQKQMVIKLQSLLDANISLNEWLQAQLAAAQGQEPIDAVPLDDMVEGSHPSYGRGLFATDNCVKQFYAAPIPRQPEPSAPEGWKLVPIEPTEAMLEVGFFAENDVFDSAKTKRIHVWKDMLAAAPQPKEQQ